jgi:transcriptional regulator with XRE-family HTH domain
MAHPPMLERLLEEMARRQLSVTQLARMAGLSESTLFRVLSGRRNLGRHALQALSRALGVDLARGGNVARPSRHGAVDDQLEELVAHIHQRLDAYFPTASQEDRESILRHLREQVRLLTRDLDQTRSVGQSGAGPPRASSWSRGAPSEPPRGASRTPRGDRAEEA